MILPRAFLTPGLVMLLSLCAGTAARAAPGFTPAPPAPAAPSTTAPPPPATATASTPPSAPAPDPDALQREALFDLAFHALVVGDLPQAEIAFAAAARLGRDPAARAVAASFLARVQALRAARAAQAAGAPRAAGAAPSVGLTPAPAPPSLMPPLVLRPPTDNSGHVPFLLTTTGLGLAVYGWTLPGLLSIKASQNPRTFVGLYMLAGAGAFLLPFLATQDEEVSAGQANLAFYGGTRGIYLGFLTGALLGGNVSLDNQYALSSGLILAGSVAGISVAPWLARRTAMTAGQAHSVSVGGDFGLGLGFGLGYLVGFTDSGLTSDQQARRMAAMGLLGTAGGIAAGYTIGRARDNTWGDAEVVRMTGFLGVFAGGTLADVMDLKNKPLATFIMAGGLMGAALGDHLVVGTDFTVGESLVIDLATIAGALGSAGLLYLVAPVEWQERPYLVAATLGGAAGLGISYWGFHARALAHAGARDDQAPGSRYAILPMIGAHNVRGVTLAAGF